MRPQPIAALNLSGTLIIYAVPQGTGLFERGRFDQALTAHCFRKDEDAEPTYTYSEFLTFFKRYLMGYGTMQFDHPFLAEKREQATRELQVLPPLVLPPLVLSVLK